MLTYYYLAQAVTTGSGDGGTIVTIVYVLTSISLIVGFIIGTYKYVQRQKKKWTNEGETRQRQQQTVAENTAQMMKNTDAIEKLTSKFTEFAVSIRTEMNGLGDRIVRLETWRHDQTGKRSDS